jgi:hypothetical protein
MYKSKDIYKKSLINRNEKYNPGYLESISLEMKYKIYLLLVGFIEYIKV